MLRSRLVNHISVLKSLHLYRFSSYASDTIYALSSGHVMKTGVAVIRVSGPHASFCLQQFTKRSLPPPRQLVFSKICCPKSNEMLDHGMVVLFPAPRSYTGEDVAEMHVHGSKAVIAGLFEGFEYLNATTENHIRPAERGEFTMRAFENGKMDLTEVEGVADLISADTSAQRKQALRVLDGHIRAIYERWRNELKSCLAHTEAVIDFGDDDRESDVNDDNMWALVPRIEVLRKDILTHYQEGRKGEIIRDGVKIVLVGLPNAGKSSLLNYLAKRPAAIVSPIAGTTRDVVEVRLDIAGVPCIVSDTAGIHAKSSGVIEDEGIARARLCDCRIMFDVMCCRRAFNDAHVCILVADGAEEFGVEASDNLVAELLEQRTLHDTTSEYSLNQPLSIIKALNKVDIARHRVSTDVSISCATGQGIAELEEKIRTEIESLLSRGDALGDESVTISRERHRHHIRNCIEHLNRFLERKLHMDLAAEELRLAMRDIGRITGAVDVEEILDVIFRDFCIGK